MTEFIKSNRAGFTLIEITIALLILAMGLIGVLTLFPVGFDASIRAANITEATFLAKGKMEDLKRMGYPAALGEDGSNGVFAGYANYEYEVFVTDGVSEPLELEGSICEAAVYVYWPAGADREDQRNVELRTFIADYEP